MVRFTSMLRIGMWLLCTSLPTTITHAADAPVKKALIFGLDGTRLDALQAAKAPHLHELIKEGTLATNTQVIGTRYPNSDTVSGPGWASNLTGVWADKHNVHNNAVQYNNFKKYPHFFARLKEVRPQAFTISLDDWLPISQFMVSGADISREISVTGAKGYGPADAKIATEAVRLLGEKNPDAMFVYFGEIDEAGHGHGFHPTVPEYRAAIERVDGLIGQVLDAVKKRKTFAQEDWLVIVTTDHGGKGKDHGGGRNIPEIQTGFLIVSGPAATRGRIDEPTYIVDLVPTALTHLGAPIKNEWKLDGRAIGLKQATP